MEGRVGGAAAAWPIGARAQQAHGLVTSARLAFGAESASTNQHFSTHSAKGCVSMVTSMARTLLCWSDGPKAGASFPELIEELISLKANVILAVSLPAALAAKSATTSKIIQSDDLLAFAAN
jgi:hypothetical protein